VDYGKLFKRAKAYGERHGLGADAEDFAQECLIKAFEVGKIRIEYVFLNYWDYQRSRNRLLSSPAGELSRQKIVSMDAVFDTADGRSGRFAERFGSRDEALDNLLEVDEFDATLKLILSLVVDDDARDWATAIYMHFLMEGVL
jgi:DNA-directed RNA polymerase specialized sigma24 family protein